HPRAAPVAPPRRRAGSRAGWKAVAPADEVAVDLLGDAGVAEADARPLAGEIVDADVLDLEQDLDAVGKKARHQVLHHLLLAVDGNALADQVAEIDVVQRAVEIEEDAAVEHALAPHAVADAELDQQVGHPLLEQPRPDPVLDVVAVAVLDDDRIDSGAAEQQREHEPGRTRAHDPDLGAHFHSSAAFVPYGTLSGGPCRGRDGSRKRLDDSEVAPNDSAPVPRRPVTNAKNA